MDNQSLEYNAALEMLETNRYSTDPLLIEMLCGILGLPLPGDVDGIIGFVQQGDVPTVDDVQLTYKKVRERLNDGGEGEVAQFMANDGNERLVIYYLTAYKNKGGDVSSMAEIGTCMRMLLSKGKTDAVRYMIEELGVTPSLETLWYEGITNEFKLWLLSMTEIRSYEEERQVLNNIFMGKYNGDVFGALIDRLLETHGYREAMQFSFDTRLLTPFEGVPLNSHMIKLFESRGFTVIPTRETHPNMTSHDLSSALSRYTSNTKEDEYMWNYLIDEMGAVPGYLSLNDAAENGNFSLVKLLVNGGIGPDWFIFILAVNGGHVEIADYLFPLVENEMKPKFDFQRDAYTATNHLGYVDNLNAMGIFLDRYWSLSISDMDVILRELYDSLRFLNLRTIRRGDSAKARLLYNLLRSTSSDARKILLRFHNSQSPMDVWIRQRILEVMDDV